MNRPLVSVILPNYNHAPYLDQRIQSILNQTYPNFELIILDDKSTDNSVEVINKYKDHPRVSTIVLNETNSGSTFIQWDRGLDLAKGDIVWIAESDDYCDPEFLETCVEEFQKTKDCVVAYCTSEYVDAENNDLGTYNPYKKEVYRMNGLDFIKQRMYYGCTIWNASSAIFRKDVALGVDKQYEDYKACGDKLFWLEMAEKGSVVHVNRVMNYFRQHLNKVSPKRFLDGTSLKEERKIFLYQVGKGYITGIKRYYIESLFLNKILSSKFNNDAIKEKLLKIWNFDTAPRRRKVKLIGRLYIYYNLYVKRLKKQE